MKRIKEDIKENVDPLGYAQRPKRACREKIVTFKESSDEEEEMLDENNNVVKQVRLKKESVESDSSEILDELKSESDSESERVEKQDKKDKVEPSKAIKVTVAPTNVAIDANDQNANCVNDFRELLLSLKTPKTSMNFQNNLNLNNPNIVKPRSPKNPNPANKA
jgi:hypothetical protein